MAGRYGLVQRKTCLRIFSQQRGVAFHGLRSETETAHHLASSAQMVPPFMEESCLASGGDLQTETFWAFDFKSTG